VDDYRMHLHVRPFVWEDKLPAQRLAVAVNGVNVGAVSLQQPAVIKCRVPWRLMQGGEVVTVVFSVPDAASPSQIKGTGDRRRLGVAFERLVLIGDAAAASPATAHPGPDAAA
jgi:hypothetical protein